MQQEPWPKGCGFCFVVTSVPEQYFHFAAPSCDLSKIGQPEGITNGMRKIAYLALLLSGCTTFFQAIAQNAPVQLSPIRQIRKGVDAWPLILNPKNDAERRINGHLTNLNTHLSHSLKECDANYAQVMGNQHPPLDDNGEGAESWTQDIKATMSGPTFLSLVATAGFYCGGAHPYGFTSAAVFDLRTGEPADPLAWFLPSLKVSLVDEDEKDSLEKSVLVAGLLQAYREATHHECDDTYPDDQQFLIWPDAKSGKVMIRADRLPGCCEACGIETGLTLKQARKLGFSEAFLQAISDAHQQLVQRQ